MALLACTWLACGGKVDGATDSAGPGTNGATNGPGTNPTAGEVAANEAQSRGRVGSSNSSSSSEPCFGHPQCDLRDVEESSEADACTGVEGTLCYKRVACQGTLWCRHFDDDQCKGWRSCDAGQTEVKTCPVGADCVVKTTCGRSILCQKLDPDCEAPLPECEILESHYSNSSGCRANWSLGYGGWPQPSPAKECFTRANACGFTVWCQAH